MFDLKLSISAQAVDSKEEAKLVTKFNVKTVGVKKDELKLLFMTRLYSGNQWKSGLCKNLNFKEMSAVILDADQGITMEDAKKIFQEYHYILHTSTSHMADLIGKGGKQERFRVILPLDPVIHTAINTPELAQTVYAHLFEKYTWADSSCKDAARKYFPFLNKLFPDLFHMEIHEGRKYFEVDLSKIDSKNLEKTAKQYISLDDVFFLPDKKKKIVVRDVTGHTRCFCNFCDDLTNGREDSAFLDLNAEGQVYLSCSHCKLTWWLHPEDTYGEIFCLGDQYVKIYQNDMDIAVSKINTAYFNQMPAEERTRLTNLIAKKRGVPAGKLRMHKLSSAGDTKATYKLDLKNWTLDIKIPPIPVIKKDNAFIDKWLDDLFGQYSDFIKDWMAIYCWSNYNPLATIVLNGVRGSGKSTWGELMKSIFPGLGYNWGGTESQFNEYNQGKLLLCEENKINHKDQYLLVKKMSGGDYLDVNEKYGQKFTVRCNVNIVIISNDERPMFLQHTEQPTDETQNQFFLYTVKPLTGPLNSHIKHDLRDRIGHYIQTELKARYEVWNNSGFSTVYRYSLPVPITPELLHAYEGSQTQMEAECDEVYDILLNGRWAKDRNGNPYKEHHPREYVKLDDIQEIIRDFSYTAGTSTGFRKHLQDLKMISKDNCRTSKGRLGWKVLKKDK